MNKPDLNDLDVNVEQSSDEALMERYKKEMDIAAKRNGIVKN